MYRRENSRTNIFKKRRWYASNIAVSQIIYTVLNTADWVLFSGATLLIWAGSFSKTYKYSPIVLMCSGLDSIHQDLFQIKDKAFKLNCRVLCVALLLMLELQFCQHWKMTSGFQSTLLWRAVFTGKHHRGEIALSASLKVSHTNLDRKRTPVCKKRQILRWSKANQKSIF